MSKPTHYAAVSSPGTKKVAICARRVGTRERLATIATCNTEDVADKIVDALNLMQDKIGKLSLPIERELETAKEGAAAERRRADQLREDLNKLRREKEEQYNLYLRKSDEAARLSRELNACKTERDGLSKKVAELQGTTTPA